MEMLYSPATVAKLIKEHDFRFAKSLGQNFLVDGNIIDKIVESGAIGPGDFVIEIGTGLGALTRAMGEKGARVHTVEIDHRLFPILEETLKDGLKADGNITLHKGDFLKMSLKEIVGISEGAGNEGRKMNADTSPKMRPVKIMGNLPYYISTPIIMKVLEENERDKLGIDSLTIMVQKEVGQRMAANPGGKDYGILSIAVQYYTTPTNTMVVPKTVFMPKPAVDSMVLNLKMRENPPVELESVSGFFKLVKKAFMQRRKTLANALTGFDGLDKMEVSDLLAAAGIDGGRRAETLSIEEFGAISNLHERKTLMQKTEGAGRRDD